MNLPRFPPFCHLVRKDQQLGRPDGNSDGDAREQLRGVESGSSDGSRRLERREQRRHLAAIERGCGAVCRFFRAGLRRLDGLEGDGGGDSEKTREERGSLGAEEE